MSVAPDRRSGGDTETTHQRNSENGKRDREGNWYHTPFLGEKDGAICGNTAGFKEGGKAG